MAQYYYFRGEYKSVHQLAYLANVSEPVLRKRLQEGWDVEDAIAIPTARRGVAVESELIGKHLQIVFKEGISSVFENMQPELNKPYITTMRKGSRSVYKTKPYCVIHLENGKPLIVYPGEFEILQVLADQPA